MSKAFTREDDDIREEPVVARLNPALPQGTTNWITADGAKRLEDELALLRERRAVSVGTGNWKRALEQRLADLEYMLATAEVVAPGGEPCEEVRFGATVQVREKGGGETSYRIVGVDETDLEGGLVSWLSPLARALLGTRRGQRVTFRFPAGEKELEIVAITDAPAAKPDDPTNQIFPGIHRAAILR